MGRILKRVAQGVLVIVGVAVAAILVMAAAARGPGGVVTPVGFKRNEAKYITMRDGVRIAIDIWVPADLAAGAKLPTMIRATRYMRAPEPGVLARAGMAIGKYSPLEHSVDALNRSGYAVILVDARGSGASFGNRQIEWSRDEVADYGEVVDWIVKQPWSNGRVGAWGVSYDGNTAELLATTERSAVKAVAPLFDDFDPSLNLVMPGGVFTSGFLRDWRDAISAMDANDICRLVGQKGFACMTTKLFVRGTKPVDGDSGRALLSQAVAGHRNYDVFDEVGGMAFPRDSMPSSHERLASVSPFGLRDRLEKTGSAMLVRVGWTDAGTMNVALGRFFSVANPQRLEIGPWSHGGGHHTDPFLADTTPTTPSSDAQFTQLIAFMDHYLKGDSMPALPREIHYYTMNEGTWKVTTKWPPAGIDVTRWYFADQHVLSTLAPQAASAADAYTIDTMATSGTANRWQTQNGGNDVIYPNRADEDRKLLTYTSEPLATDIEITGVPVVSLQVASSATDGSFHVYLEDVAPDGRVTYITEGIFRAINRRVSTEAPPYRVFGPYHTYRREDALPLIPGQTAELAFELFATSVRLKAGHRVRVAVAGADRSMFTRVPSGAPPTISLHREKGASSYIDLPMRELASTPH